MAAVVSHGRGQVPVRGRGEHRHQVAHAGQVELRRRGAQDGGVDEQRVRPARGRRALDAAVQQHGERVGVTVDAGCRLDGHQGSAVPGGGLADISDRPGPDGDDAAGAGGCLPGCRHGPLVRMHLPVSRPEGGPVDGETAAEYLGGLSSQVPAGHPHRRRRREHDHARPGPGKAGDRAGEFVERAVALDDPAEAERLQPPGSGRCGQLGPQRRQVEPDRLARAHLTGPRFPARCAFPTGTRFPARCRILARCAFRARCRVLARCAFRARSRILARTRIPPRSWMLISNRLPSTCPRTCPRSARTGLTGPARLPRLAGPAPPRWPDLLSGAHASAPSAPSYSARYWAYRSS